MSQSQQAPKGGQQTRVNPQRSARVVDLAQQRRIRYRPRLLGGGRRPEGLDLQAAWIFLRSILALIGAVVAPAMIYCLLTGQKL